MAHFSARALTELTLFDSYHNNPKGLSRYADIGGGSWRRRRSQR
jgi:hypothetical protein